MECPECHANTYGLVNEEPYDNRPISTGDSLASVPRYTAEYSCSSCGYAYAEQPGSRPPASQRTDLYEYAWAESSPMDFPVSPTTAVDEPPACQVCGRQDETLRIVAFPFVFSLVLVTFRRAFAGLWCSRHRSSMLWLASLITAVLGWIGIPFGFIWTPIVLFQLAQGGKQPPQENAQILRALADYKKSRGDAAGAVRCLEASLEFSDDQALCRELRLVRLSLPRAFGLNPILAILSGLGGAMLLGLLVGLLDYSISHILASIIKGNVSIYIIILDWAISIALAFIGGLMLFQVIRWVVARARSTHLLANAFFGGLLGLVGVYSILQGYAFALLFRLMVTPQFQTADNWLRETIVTLLLGAIFYFQSVTESQSLGTTLQILFLILTALYFVGFGIATAVQTSAWQRRIARAIAGFS